MRTGTSGGIISARDRWPGCTGHVPELPSLTLDVRVAGSYAMAVRSEGDTTLVVVGPGGPFCNDDFHGSNPLLTETLSVGQYQVYVGSYSRMLSHPFEFLVQTTGHHLPVSDFFAR